MYTIFFLLSQVINIAQILRNLTDINNIFISYNCLVKYNLAEAVPILEDLINKGQLVPIVGSGASVDPKAGASFTCHAVA
ncbi:MAG: hypothetical protein U0T81_10770 [Saprospiraceae bacterium]